MSYKEVFCLSLYDKAQLKIYVRLISSLLPEPSSKASYPHSKKIQIIQLFHPLMDYYYFAFTESTK